MAGLPRSAATARAKQEVRTITRIKLVSASRWR